MKLVSHPVLCNYYVTYKCNATCGFCDIWEKPSNYAKLDHLEDNLEALKRLGVKVIDFTGGEPLLHPEIDKILTLAKKYGFITTLTTNCLLYQKKALKIKGKIDMLHFSLDSYKKDKHDAMRGVECFDFVLDSVKRARELGEHPDILFTVFNDNIEDIKEVYEEVCLQNNLILILNPAFDYGSVNGKKLSPDQLNILSDWGKKRNVYLNKGFIKLRQDGGNKTKAPVCKAASSTIVISPENELILPCYHLSEKQFPIHDNLRELYRSREVKQIIKQEGKLPSCEGCAINCYMQPSFAVNLNKYWFYALPSTIKYLRMKRRLQLQ